MKSDWKRRWLKLGGGLLLGALAIVCFALPASAAEYSDINGHWAQSSIKKWSDTGILSGYTDGTFRPDRTVTRAELSAILYRIWGSMKADSYFSYPDVQEGDWYYDSLLSMNAYGIALNTGNAMNPSEDLTREEAVYMIAKAFLVGSERDEFTNGNILDLRKVSDYRSMTGVYTGRISGMLAQGYVSGFPDGTFSPQSPITRAQVITIIDNMMDIYISEPGEYEVPMGKQVLITTCGNVIIHIKKTGETRENVRICLMNDAAQGSVTVSYEDVDGSGKAPVGFCTVSETTPQYQIEGDILAGRASFMKTGSPIPDTRFGGGQGTSLFPYIISTPEQLKLLTETTGDPMRRYFELDRDLDLGTISEPFDAGEEMSGTTLDGAGHTITYHMSGDITAHFAGLFSAWYGSCSNLTVDGEVDVSLADTENGRASFGGFAGYLQGNLTNCVSLMNIHITGASGTDDLNVGGLVGFSLGSKFINCVASGQVSAVTGNGQATVGVGGLIGSCGVTSGLYPGVKFNGCGADGSVHAAGGHQILAGGILGAYIVPSDQSKLTAYNYGLVENTWSTAVVSAEKASFQIDCGGIVGQINAATVRSSWAKPTLSNENSGILNIGSIAGACYENGTISDCWSNADACQISDHHHTGGITGRLRGAAVSNCYVLGAEKLGAGNAIVYNDWNDGIVTDCTDLTGVSKAQTDMFCRDSGWDFERVWEQGEAYPTLRGCDDKEKQLECQ